jgi:hypothetical protein
MTPVRRRLRRFVTGAHPSRAMRLEELAAVARPMPDDLSRRDP